MDITRDASSVSWVPATPSKPPPAEEGAICADGKENHIIKRNGLESEQLCQANLLEANIFPTSQSNGCGEVGDNVYTYPNFSPMHSVDKNMPFCDLLALANAATSTSAAPDVNGIFGFIPVTPIKNGCSIYLQPSFDLNSPPRPITEKEEKELVTDMTAEVVELTQSNDVLSAELQKKHITDMTAEVVELTQSNDVVSSELQEKHNANDNGSLKMNTTAHQKPRRKKYMPKVVKEGKSKKTPQPRTPNPRTPKVVGPYDTPTGKRKYVRKKGIDNSPVSPSVDAISIITESKMESKTILRATRSCRKSLNFDSESQVRDESSNQPDFGSESHALNFTTCMQPGVQLGHGTEGIIEKEQVRFAGHGTEGIIEKEQVGFAYDITFPTNKEVKNYISMPNKQAQSPSTLSKSDQARDKLMADAQNECTRAKCRIVFSDVTHDKESNIVQILDSNSHSAPRSPNDSNSSTTECLTKEKQTRGVKRGHGSATGKELCNINAIGAHHDSMQAYMAMFPVYQYGNDRIPDMYFPPIYKKKRTEKCHNSAASISLPTVCAAKQTMEHPLKGTRGYPSTSETNCTSSAGQCNGTNTPNKTSEGTQDKPLSFRCMLTLSTTEAKKKRSKGPTRARDLASLIDIVEGMQLPTFPTRVATSIGISHQPHSCMEALVADTHAATATKKRTKRNSLANSWTPGPYPGIVQKDMFSIDALVEHLKHLDINAERQQVAYSKLNALSFYSTRYQEQNALVVYQRDRTLVPFEGPFNPIKKRRPRPRVDLDDETTRVWKLLLQDINSEGINGTDEEKEKWWEEERRVFGGRADSFIARMHLIQGDRRFSKWKGSIVDSVVGVFLTQNVSDHLSSSAFMSLAARFPLVSNNVPASKERMNISSVNEPEACVLDPDDTIEWHGVKSNQPACDQISMKLQDVGYNEEREFDNSNESSVSSTDGVRSKDGSNFQLDFASCGIGMYGESALDRSTTLITGTMSSFNGYQKEVDDVISSQNSVISSQNSMDSSIAEVAERSFSQTNLEAEPVVMSRPNSFAGTTSFVELLRMAETTNCNGFYNPEVSSSKKIESNQFKSTACDLRKQDDDRSDGSKASRGPLIPSSYQLLHLTPNSKEVECIDMLGEVSKSSSILEEDKDFFPVEESRSSAESASQATVQHIVAMDSHEASKSSAENYLPHNSLQVESNKIYQSQTLYEDPKNRVKSPTQEKICQVEKFSVPNFSVPLDVTRILDDSRTKGQKEIESNSNDNACLPQKNLNGLNATTSKAKRGRMGKEKQIAVEWDSLRKQAQVSGERERTANMDSVDWEAVRLADVAEVAYTIRERGMNNMLAERIKAFLDRLVRDHGSIDLEWLRDVPPDKAKEYLLSFRGLGLKSVECVRLLTLHHLAFPVDTNVGRIAVRLGWVPLQPLPESLQLHLLEMYPVLESIQKYLWPRLCKLDQRTLYELHYQMITFGKVFCTKSKPNCNACPMRGECRHFASAFASARLALPAPEEKSLVTTENNAINQSPVGIIKRLQLPVPQTNQQQEAQSEVSICEPIIEVPASPEPIIEVPATPEPERTRNLENDIEDIFGEDPEEIPTIKLNIEEFTQTLQEYMQHNMELQECDVSKALVALTPEAASIPTVKLKNVSRLRTEHQVYELPDSHPLLEGLAAREPDDPCKYLLAIWTPGETADSIQPPGGQCSCQESGNLCHDHTCYTCSSAREANSQTVRGTLLIPCRTAMRGSFPLNGTYFQVNEVFADHESSLNPIDVPRSWIWNLPRKTVFFGTSIPTIFKGLSTQGIQFCFWKGFVCVRGFDQNTRAPRPLMARLHFPASKLARGKEKFNE